jgi:hypothetical protein
MNQDYCSILVYKVLGTPYHAYFRFDSNHIVHSGLGAKMRPPQTKAACRTWLLHVYRPRHT